MIGFIRNLANRTLSQIDKFKNIDVFPKRIYNLNGKQQNSSETNLEKLLQEKFPKAKSIKVQDVSGGCGAMYEIFVESVDFKGLSVVKQHQSICEALKEQIKTFHGVRIHTQIPK